MDSVHVPVGRWGGLFPDGGPTIRYTDLRMTTEGEYSITRRWDGEAILKAVRNIVGSTRHWIIVDGTANVGGETILWALHSAKVVAIEKDSHTCQILQHNVALYGLSDRVEIVNGDTCRLWPLYPCDMVCLDPPWGGPDYKNTQDLELFMGDRLLHELVVEMVDAPVGPTWILLKVPANYKWNSKWESLLLHRCAVHQIPIRSFFIVLIHVKNRVCAR
jgi:hypothetical protein